MNATDNKFVAIVTSKVLQANCWYTFASGMTDFYTKYAFLDGSINFNVQICVLFH